MKVKVVKKFDKKVFSDVSELLFDWWKKKHTLKISDFKQVLKRDYLICVFDDKKVVGIATLVPVQKLSNFRGSIEHVIVSKNYRGQGLGKLLMAYALKLAKKLKMQSVSLTCDPKNTVAGALYKKVGFKPKNTIFFEQPL